MKTIHGKTIWITGASSGIGAALAQELGAMDCTLVLSARNEAALHRVRQACTRPEKVHVVPMDLSDFDGMIALTDSVLALVGSVDVLVNNAGLSQRSLLIDTKFEVFKTLIDINYLGTVALTKALLPHFVRQGGGYFVTVSSLMGKFGSPYRSGYCAAKHALHGFFDVLRMEHEKDGIQVSIVCPGFVQTKVAQNALTETGTAQSKDDSATANGLPVSVFVKKMIRVMEKQKFEAYIGRKETIGVYLKRFFPKRLHRTVLKSKVR